jgi:uncharacterized protein YciI
MTDRRDFSIGALGLLAASLLPAKEYKMTTYTFGLLRKGPKWTPQSTDETQRIQAGHMANITKMAESGHLLVAGPFQDGGDLRGIFVFGKGTREELRAMVDEDPAVKAGRLVVDLYTWYAAAGLKVDQ